jgi:2'-5' RNA ligase
MRPRRPVDRVAGAVAVLAEEVREHRHGRQRYRQRLMTRQNARPLPSERAILASVRAEYLAVVHLLHWLPHEPIATFRRAHDPTVDLVDPHITLVFAIPESIGHDRFPEHVHAVVSRTPRFEIRLHGLEASWDHWLFLLVREGRERVIDLHDQLYGGILQPFLRTDLTFVPHVGLGLFVEPGDEHDLFAVRERRRDRGRFHAALAEAEALRLDHTGPFDRVHIVQLDEELTHVTPLDELALPS